MGKKDTFAQNSVREVTSIVLNRMKGQLKAADGDLLVVQVVCAKDNKPYLIASFHGESNGNLSTPILNAYYEAMQEEFGEHIAVLGMDANVHEEAKAGFKHFPEFLADVLALGM